MNFGLKMRVILVVFFVGIPMNYGWAVPRSIRTEPELPTKDKYDYATALKMSLLFFEAQRSGKLPADNRIPWRGDSALGDKGERGEDLTGGYYDAGDFVKYVWTQAAASTLVAWSLHTSAKGYQQARALKRGLECLKWASDFFIKCHVSPNELYGQIGDYKIDQKYWGRPEEMNMTRPAYKIDVDKPGSDLAGEVAAALAATSLVFREHGDTQYADLCLMHAKQLYQFARDNRGFHHISMKISPPYYESQDYGDELAWAAAWLYKATNDVLYLTEAEHHYHTFGLKERPREFSVGYRSVGVQILLAELTRKPEFISAAQSFCDYQINEQRRTPKGLIIIKREGILGQAANVAFVCIQLAKLTSHPKSYHDLARKQINYILGDTGRSYVVGFGENPPTQPCHTASSCPSVPEPCGWDHQRSPKPNPQILYGALVSGPSENDQFIDTRDDFIYTEVTIDFNAGFQGTLAALIQLSHDDAYKTAETDFKKSDDNFIIGNSKLIDSKSVNGSLQQHSH